MAYQKGSGFVGLQQYLNANQQAAANLGGVATGIVGGAQAGVRSAADDEQRKLEQAAAAGVPVYSDPGDASTAQARAGGAQGTAYTGPQGLSNETEAALSAKAQAADKTAQYGTTDAGVATLLQQKYGNGYTGVGGRSLDAFLARRGAGEQLDTIAKTGLQGMQDYLRGTRERSNQAVENARVATAGVRNQYAGYQPPQTIDAGPKKNPIKTPGTMPEAKQPRRMRDTRVGRWLGGILGGG